MHFISSLLIAVILFQEPSGLIPFDPDCGYTKGCFPACESGCDYLATWHAHDGNVDFELQMKLDKTDSTWVAIGISPGGQMVRVFFS